MRFYDCKTAPSPRMVRIFIAEKSIELETVQIDLARGEHMSAEFARINPALDVPVLELDDGTCISQIDAICRYLEEVYPEPPLWGRTPAERGLVNMWNHQVMTNGFQAMAEAFRNATPGLANRALTGPHNYAQIPELAARGRQRMAHFFADMDAHLAASHYLVGDYLSISDLKLMALVDFAKWIKITLADTQVNLQRHYNEMSARPSAKV